MLLAVDRANTIEDWRAIRAICALTGKSGEAVEKERREFFSEFWISPYEKLSPQWAYVLRDPEGLVGGYLVASPETRDFRRRAWISCELPLAGQILLRRNPGFRTPDARKFMRRFLRLEPRPESLFSDQAWRKAHREYPAHLQMNLLGRFRRKGHGSALVMRLIRDLRVNDVPGVHCICGEMARPFFEALGFETLEGVLFARTIRLYLLGKRVIEPGVGAGDPVLPGVGG